MKKMKETTNENQVLKRLQGQLSNEHIENKYPGFNR